MLKRRGSLSELPAAKRARQKATPEFRATAEIDTQALPLPTELLHIVCSHLGTHGVCKFRLACKAFAEIGNEHLFEELCFCLSFRSFEKIESVALKPMWARQVKTLVLENVQPKDWQTMSREFNLANEDNQRGEAKYRAFLANWWVRARLYACLIGNHFYKFTNLRTIILHHGFKDNRSPSPHANTAMQDMFNHTFGQENFWAFWKNRHSGCVFSDPKFPATYGYGVSSRCLSQGIFIFYRQIRKALTNDSNKLLDSVIFHSHHSVSLDGGPKSARESLVGDSRLKQLTLLYRPYFRLHSNSIHLPQQSEEPLTFLRDLRHLSAPFSGDSNLRFITLGSDLDEPRDFLDLTPLGGNFSPSWPNLQEISFVNCSFDDAGTIRWLSQQHISATMKNVEFCPGMIEAFSLYKENSLRGLKISGLMIVRRGLGLGDSLVWLVCDECLVSHFAERFRNKDFRIPFAPERNFWRACSEDVETCLLLGQDIDSIQAEETQERLFLH